MRRITRKIDDLIVLPRASSRRRLFGAAIGVIALIVAAFLLYNYGLISAGYDSSAVSVRHKQLTDEIARLNDENQALREGLSRAELLVQTNQTAHEELDRTLKGSAQEIMKLREEVDFYRNIISPANKISGLQIQRLHVASDSEVGEYRYRLVLIQALKHERTVDGRVEFEVLGDKGAASMRIRFPDNERGINFSFKYFQDIEGRWKLPVGFQPKAVVVRVTTGAGPGAEETFPWPQAAKI